MIFFDFFFEKAVINFVLSIASFDHSTGVPSFHFIPVIPHSIPFHSIPFHSTFHSICGLSGGINNLNTMGLKPRPQWSHTIGLKPRPLISGRQLFPLYLLADIIFGWPLIPGVNSSRCSRIFNDKRDIACFRLQK